jgi:hypothetical protein
VPERCGLAGKLVRGTIPDRLTLMCKLGLLGSGPRILSVRRVKGENTGLCQPHRHSDSQDPVCSMSSEDEDALNCTLAQR